MTLAAAHQFSPFDTRPLFDDETLRRAQEGWDRSAIPDLNRRSVAAEQFIQQVQLRSARALKEEALEQQFNRAFFVELLGYETFPGSSGSWTAWPKPSTHDTHLSGEPDLLLGRFSNQVFEPLVVVELKKPSVPLDAPQGSYGGKTPVEQAFGYARRLGACRWVCVSNMRFLRLYSIESASSYFEMDLWAQRPSRHQLKDLWHLLAFENLVEHDDSPSWRLLVASQGRQVDFQEGFYAIYGDIRRDILQILETERPDIERPLLVQATQRLLDRLMFIYFCEDHPDRLLKKNLVKDVVDNAVRLPGSSQTKAYDALKALFHDLDVGADTEFWKVPRYNGELFKPHPILDTISLPDSLHSKRYLWVSPDSASRRAVQGAYGLHIFDFWKELDRDLLGNVFERSIGDLSTLTSGGVPNVRQTFGIYYTASRLARFAARSAIEAALGEDPELRRILDRPATEDLRVHGDQVRQITERLKTYKIADIACGSGVFLSAAFDALLAPFRKALEAGPGGGLSREVLSFEQSAMLKSTIFGCDILPQAVELAKLSLWLAAARRNEPSADLTSNFATGDSLFTSVADDLANAAGGSFSVIVGNPPWGAELSDDSELDSWELFLRKCSDLLAPGGRLALILPDTLFFSAKTDTRRWLLQGYEIEKLHSLGPDWFTNKVRMGTVFLQARKRKPEKQHLIRTLVLSGSERTLSQRGLRPIEQAEAIGSASLLQSRALESEGAALEVLLGEEERPLIDRIRASSVSLSSITKHGRGDEMSSNGSFWRCGNCNVLAVPGTKRKGGGFNSKDCPVCGSLLTENNVQIERLVSPRRTRCFHNAIHRR